MVKEKFVKLLFIIFLIFSIVGVAFILKRGYFIDKKVSAQTSLAISNVYQSSNSIALYDKVELKFDITGTVATNLQWPYDPGPVNGMSEQSLRTGITVDGLFLPPGQTNWGDALVVPAFFYQPTLKDRSINGGTTNAEWIYPSGNPYWLIRFAPKQVGTWQFRIRAQDNSNYPNWVETTPKSFSVTAARPGVHGFVQVSSRDRRYFEYSDGTVYTGTGVNAADNGIYHSEQQAEIEFRDRYSAGKINLARTWMDMELVFSRGTHGWDAWNTTLGTSDDSRTTAQVYKDHDFSLQLGGGKPNYIFQYQNGNQRMAGGLEANKVYRVRVRAYGDTDNLAVRLISDRNNFASTVLSMGPNPGWTILSDEVGWKLLESTFTNTRGRLLFSGQNNLAVGTTSGTVYLDEVYIGEDLGGGRIGPNVVFKGKMNYHQYFDQIASSNWDDIYTHAENYGIALKVVISDKQDFILNKIRLSDGIFDPTIGIDHTNFHSQRGYKVRRLHEYYWRYLAARWGYSRGIHSWELLNEGNPGSAAHYDQTNHLAETIDALDHNHMVTTSFWSSFPASKIWGNSNYPAIDYADVHAYISTGWIRDSSLESDAAKYHIVYSQDTRDSLLSTGVNKPIVRGEAGIDVLGQQNEQDILASDTNGVWLHNFTWSGLDPGGLYELYWWSDNIRNRPGPDGNSANGLFEIFKDYNEFMTNIPLNAGGYVDIGVASSGNSRVVGQKNNNGNGSTLAHLWIQDTRHTFKSTSAGNLSGTFTITGMKPNTSFPVEIWSFNTRGQLSKSSSNLSSNSSGQLTISISQSSFNGSAVVDAAVKIGDYPAVLSPPPLTPTPPAELPGDADRDGDVDGVDFSVWLGNYGQNLKGAAKGDFNNSGVIEIGDYVIWVSNFSL